MSEVPTAGWFGFEHSHTTPEDMMPLQVEPPNAVPLSSGRDRLCKQTVPPYITAIRNDLTSVSTELPHDYGCGCIFLPKGGRG